MKANSPRPCFLDLSLTTRKGAVIASVLFYRRATCSHDEWVEFVGTVAFDYLGAESTEVYTEMFGSPDLCIASAVKSREARAFDAKHVLCHPDKGIIIPGIKELEQIENARLVTGVFDFPVRDWFNQIVFTPNNRSHVKTVQSFDGALVGKLDT